MLVLSRRKNESIVINENILVTIIEVRGEKVRVGVTCDKSIPVHRFEVQQAINNNKETKTEAA
jgi:carbon storage regulator